MISHKQTLKGKVKYSLKFRESSLLSKPKQTIKVDLTKTSILAVLIQDPAEIFNLAAMLDSALPKMAGLTLVLFSLNTDAKKLQ